MRKLRPPLNELLTREQADCPARHQGAARGALRPLDPPSGSRWPARYLRRTLADFPEMRRMGSVRARREQVALGTCARPSSIARSIPTASWKKC